MTKADWTYQVPEAGEGAAGLEDYVVEGADGELVGKVIALLRRGGDVFLAVQRGTPPVTSDLRAVPWRDVATIDHSALAVRLGVGGDALEGALELDAGKRVEGEGADAVRLTSLPRELIPPAAAGATRPVDRPSYAAALGTGALGLIVFLALVLAATQTSFSWEFALFALPAALLALSGWLALRLYRAPYER